MSQVPERYEWAMSQRDTNETRLIRIYEWVMSKREASETWLVWCQKNTTESCLTKIWATVVATVAGSPKKNINVNTKQPLTCQRDTKEFITRIIYHTYVTHEDGTPFVASESYKGIYHSYHISHIYDVSHISYVTHISHMKTSRSFEVSERSKRIYHTHDICNISHIIFTTHVSHMKTKQPLMCQRDIKEYITHIIHHTYIIYDTHHISQMYTISHISYITHISHMKTKHPVTLWTSRVVQRDEWVVSHREVNEPCVLWIWAPIYSVAAVAGN